MIAFCGSDIVEINIIENDSLTSGLVTCASKLMLSMLHCVIGSQEWRSHLQEIYEKKNCSGQL